MRNFGGYLKVGKVGHNNDTHDFEGNSPLKKWFEWGQSHDYHKSHNETHHGHKHKYHDSPTAPAPNTNEAQYSALLTEEAREADGTGNNLANDNWGSAGSELLRLAPASYADGAGVPNTGVNPRDISNAILDQDGLQPNSFDASDLFTFFGQFIDHDIDLTPEAHGGDRIEFTHADGDFGITRSGSQAGTGTDASNPLQFPN